MTIYSHSKLSSFEQCPLKFKFRYIDKLKPDIENTIEGYLGTKVHDTLEWVYNEILKGRTREFTLDEIIKHYAISWNNNHTKEIKIVKQEFTAEDYFNKGIKFLIDYFIKNKPFKDNTIETEKRIFLTLNDGNKIIGFIDRLTHNKETNILEIHDYKTSNSIKSQEELDKDRQLALYSLAIKQIFPEAQDIHLVWHFLNFNKKIISKRTPEQLEQLKQDIMQLIKKIESTTEFPPCKSALCDWCEFQSYCPLMQQEQLNKHREFQQTLTENNISKDIKENPKILVASPTYDRMEYCHKEFFNKIKNLSYSNYDVLIVDNSRNNEYFKKIKNENIIALKDNTNETKNALRLISSRNKIITYALENNYDHILMLDSDVIPPKNIIEELLICKKDIVSGLYFNQFIVSGKPEIHPVAYKCLTEKEFEEMKKKVNFPPNVKSHLDIKYHLTKEDTDSNKLIEVLICSAGCMMLSKNAFKQLHYELIDTSNADNIQTSDDIFFMLKARELGFKIYCNTKLKCKHLVEGKFRKDKDKLVHPFYD